MILQLIKQMFWQKHALIISLCFIDCFRPPLIRKIRTSFVGVPDWVYNSLRNGGALAPLQKRREGTPPPFIHLLTKAAMRLPSEIRFINLPIGLIVVFPKN